MSPSLAKLALGREDQKFASDNLQLITTLCVFDKFFFNLFCFILKDQQPVVPQPTNYKPKVINDIRAQVHKGRWVNYELFTRNLLVIFICHEKGLFF